MPVRRSKPWTLKKLLGAGGSNNYRSFHCKIVHLSDNMHYGCVGIVYAFITLLTATVSCMCASCLCFSKAFK